MSCSHWLCVDAHCALDYKVVFALATENTEVKQLLL